MTEPAADAEKLLQQAFAAYRSGDFAAAERHCRDAIAAQPRRFDAYHMLAVVQVRAGRPQEALTSCDLALSLRPDDPLALSNRAVMLNALGRYEEAVASCNVALSLQPDAAPTLENRGIALSALTRFDAAMASYDRALELQPEFAECRVSRASLLLLRGAFVEGWREYEWRRKLATWAAPRLEGPEWQGDDLSGRRLLLYGEGWPGDTIQFARFVPLLAARAREIVLQVEPPLCELMRRIAGAPHVVAAGETPPPYDCHLPLASVPFVLGIEEGKIPAAAPYLSADPERAGAWSERLPKAAFRVGIACEVEPGRGGWQERPIPQAAFAPLGRVPGVQLIALGEDAASGGAAASGLRSIVPLGVDFAAGLNRFLELAAVMMQLDLVVTGDGAIAHLAGALGRPVWILLKDAPAWRWLLDRTDSPWYPTARLFRQQQRGDWDGVMTAAAAELAALVPQKLAVERGLRIPTMPSTQPRAPIEPAFASRERTEAVPVDRRSGAHRLRSGLAARLPGVAVASVLMLAPLHPVRWSAGRAPGDATRSLVADVAGGDVAAPRGLASAARSGPDRGRPAAASVMLNIIPPKSAPAPPHPAALPISAAVPSGTIHATHSPTPRLGKPATAIPPAIAHTTPTPLRSPTNIAAIPPLGRATKRPSATPQPAAAAARDGSRPAVAPNPGAARPPSPAVAAMNAEWRARGDALFVTGDVTSARLFYRQAAERGDGRAALQLGESYDPAFLAQARIGSVQADPKAAAHWYGRARNLGIADARILLKGLATDKVAGPSR